MLGRKELASLDQQKQVLLLESGLNRLTFQAEARSLRSASAWMRDVTGASRGLAPLLMLIAPLAGFLVARRSRRPNSWFSRLMAVAKWAAPLYRLWKSISARRGTPEAGKLAN
jgi:cytochrome b561